MDLDIGIRINGNNERPTYFTDFFQVNRECQSVSQIHSS